MSSSGIVSIAPAVDREGDVVEVGVNTTTIDNSSASGFKLQRYTATNIELTAAGSCSRDNSAGIRHPGVCRRVGCCRTYEVPAAHIFTCGIEEYDLYKHDTAGP